MRMSTDFCLIDETFTNELSIDANIQFKKSPFLLEKCGEGRHYPRANILILSQVVNQY